MGVEEVVKAASDVVTFGAISRREQTKAQDKARKEQEAKELAERKAAAERKPEEETATLELVGEDEDIVGGQDLLIEPLKKPTSLGSTGSTGLGFNV